MHINADFSKTVILDSNKLEWEDTPMNGVHRRKLDRIGDEVARATTIVKYAPKSYFNSHRHDGGEEIIVLKGIFSDEHGDYPAGTYIRNPIGTSHKPHSEEGCIIFVKLQQFDEADQKQFTINTLETDFTEKDTDGINILPLHKFGNEICELVRIDPGSKYFPKETSDGEEIFVLAGTLSDENGHYSKGTWLRSPNNSLSKPYSENGCLIYKKTGHLPQK